MVYIITVLENIISTKFVFLQNKLNLYFMKYIFPLHLVHFSSGTFLVFIVVCNKVTTKNYHLRLSSYLPPFPVQCSPTAPWVASYAP